MKSDNGRVLVVDDNEANRDVLSRRLKRQGHHVLTAENGRQALQVVQQESIDLIILDIMMPEMNGYQVLEHLKANPDQQHIPIIMISAVDDIESVAKCIQMGAEDYLFKPFNHVLLKARVNAILEKKWLRDKEQAYLQTMKQELELGRRTQADFLPDKLPHASGWEIAAVFHPAREVAGDFYDVFDLPDNRIGLVIADVCDKGVGAALFMVVIRSLMRAFAEQATSINTDPLDAVGLTNNYIAHHHNHNQPQFVRFATLFFGVLDPSSGILNYVNGGHEPPILIRTEGSWTTLETTGPALGFIQNTPFGVEQVQFNPGTRLVLYTDGLTDARNTRREMFGEERLLKLLEQPAPTVAMLMERIEAGVKNHVGVGNETLTDDLTMLVIEYLG